MALISVSDKTGLDDISSFLLAKDIQIISTGGTYRKIMNGLGLEKNKNLVKTVEDITEYPEMLGGRVKTLHPRIAGAILARKNLDRDVEDMKTHNIPHINIVIVNLYPFRKVIDRKGTTQEEAIENIDIGGHTLIRESAKNFQDILIVVDPNDYNEVINNFDNIDLEFRKRYATKALKHATQYDIDIVNYYIDNVDKNNDPTKKLDLFRHYKKEYDFKYGCNPQQGNASLYTINSGKNPFVILNGAPGYINIIDAFHSWQLVNELSDSLNLCAAASFKHTSPAGVGTSVPLSDNLKYVYGVKDVDITPLSTAFIRARYTDPMSSFGDFIALSHKVDVATAKLIKREVSDGVIAPDYDPEALSILKNKKNGRYMIIQVDKLYFNSNIVEIREMFGLAITQEPNNYKTSIKDSFNNIVTDNGVIMPSVIRDLTIANISLKYAQSNNVAYAYDGQLLGIASGQQNRVDCVRLAGEKAKIWCLLQHPNVHKLRECFKDGVKRQDKVNACIRYIQDNFTDVEFIYWSNNFRDDVILPEPISSLEKRKFVNSHFNKTSMASDAFFPFRDNIDVASQYGVKYILQPGGSTADKDVIKACNEYSMIMAFSGARMFYH